MIYPQEKSDNFNQIAHKTLSFVEKPLKFVMLIQLLEILEKNIKVNFVMIIFILT